MASAASCVTVGIQEADVPTTIRRRSGLANWFPQRHFLDPRLNSCLRHFCVTCRPRATFFSVQPWTPSRSIFRNPHTSGQAGRTIYHPRRTIEPLRRVAPVCARNDVITDVILRCNPAHPRRRQRADLRLYWVAPKTEDAAFDCPRLLNARTSLQSFAIAYFNII